jgi:hypothetical protein
VFACCGGRLVVYNFYLDQLVATSIFSSAAADLLLKVEDHSVQPVTNETGNNLGTVLDTAVAIAAISSLRGAVSNISPTEARALLDDAGSLITEKVGICSSFWRPSSCCARARAARR